ncbi:hypothetical protein KAW65_01555 [candidate division WOR-3 bacterium]|nr:hypothetical protein [candidate division WOR-3 bacterium]
MIFLLIVICPALSLVVVLFVWKQIYAAKIEAQTRTIIEESISIFAKEHLKTALIKKCIEYYKQYGKWDEFLNSQNLSPEEIKLLNQSIKKKLAPIPN